MTATTLSTSLREGTHDSHRLAEQTPFIRSLFQGQLSLEAYREFMLQLLHVYQALEDAHSQQRNHPLLGRLHFPALFRAEAIRRDLDYYFGGRGWQNRPLRAATAAYVQRIDALAREWPDGLVAHHYTRYLGDLSGGQAMKRVVAKMFNLSAGEGLAFYDFPQIADHAEFKEQYRALLDALPVDAGAARRIVDEANLAFQLNRDVFAAMTKMPD